MRWAACESISTFGCARIGPALHPRRIDRRTPPTQWFHCDLPARVFEGSHQTVESEKQKRCNRLVVACDSCDNLPQRNYMRQGIGETLLFSMRNEKNCRNPRH